MPRADRCRRKSLEVNWADSTGRRDTSSVEVSMGRPARWMAALTGRSPMKSSGAPSHRREVEREFWCEMAKGLLPEEAARLVGVSQAVGSRWFRHGGGMPSVDLAPLSGRYLSFREREEIAMLRVQGAGVRQTARRLCRSPSTISRELRRNAATRGGRLDYRASVAQWKAELVAQRPKTAKLVANERLREYVQERLSGQVRRPDGTPVAGPGLPRAASTGDPAWVRCRPVLNCSASLILPVGSDPLCVKRSARTERHCEHRDVACGTCPVSWS